MKIFMSYRRSDAQDFAGRLADRLRMAPGIGDVFIDVVDISGGEDFAQRIRTSLARCDAALVVIGEKWLGASQRAVSRMFEDDDFVRMEVREALHSGKKVIPVLANGAAMPSIAELPEDIQRIATLHAVPVRHSDFEHDIEVLLDALFARKKPGRMGAWSRRHPLVARVVRSVAGASAALALLVVALAVINAVTGQSLSDIVGGTGPAMVFATLIVAAGAGIPWMFRAR